MSRRRARSIDLLLALLCVAAMTLAACGGDDGGGDAPADTGGADTADAAVDTPDAGDEDTADEDTTPIDAADTSTDTADTQDEPDASACPESMLCLDERTGRPSVAVCINGGFPAGSTCERRSPDVACCVAPFRCETDTDCEDAREEMGFCEDPRYPCVCDTDDGTCAIGLCSADSDCAEGEVCEAGLCETPTEEGTYVAEILDRPGQIAPGTTAQLHAMAVNVDDRSDVDAGATIEWSVDDEAVATIGDDGVLTAGSMAGDVTITATVASNDDDPGDTVVFTNLGAAPDADAAAQVVIVDEVSRAPLEGATVGYMGADGMVWVTTDTEGIALVDADSPFSIHVMAEDHSLVSALDVSERQVLIALPPVQRAGIREIRGGDSCEAPAVLDETDCGGPDESACLCYDLEGVDVVSGFPDFDLVANTGELWASLSGFSLGNSLLDLNFDLIVGPNVEREFPPDSPLPIEEAAEIPSGVTLHFNGRPIVEKFIATAPPGRRTLWSVGGIVSTSQNPDLIPNILEATGGDVAIGNIVAAILPLFRDFYSGVQTGVEMQAGGTFPIREPDLRLRVPTARKIDIVPHMLPELGEGWVDTAVFLGGAWIPGEGLVPLGATAAVDTVDDRIPADGILDGDSETRREDEPVLMSMAPIHSGIAGAATRYMIASVAIQLGDLPDGVNEASSGIITLFEPGDALPADLSFGDETFPGFAEGSSYNTDTRTATISGLDSRFEMLRLVFKGDAGVNWIVYAPAGSESVTLPNPADAGEFPDPTMGGDWTVVAVGFHAFIEGGYQSLLAPNEYNLTDIFEVVSEFSLIGF